VNGKTEKKKKINNRANVDTSKHDFFFRICLMRRRALDGCAAEMMHSLKVELLLLGGSLKHALTTWKCAPPTAAAAWRPRAVAGVGARAATARPSPRTPGRTRAGSPPRTRSTSSSWAWPG
jgi:hypothetical protein